MSRGLVAVVLAGGSSRRFGSDKLAADAGGRALLDRVLDGLPPEAEVVVVGPPRPLGRPARFVREDPPGGGPGAALLTGVRAARDAGAQRVLVVPGDAPGAGTAADLLLGKVAAHPVVVAVDPEGRRQHLLLGLSAVGADALLSTDAGGGSGVRAGELLSRLRPAAVGVPVPREACFDVDTPGDLAALLRRPASGAPD